MNERRLFLISPYRPPTTHQVYLNADEMAAWLNGYASLWHPALLRGAAGLPEVASSYDHEQPTAGHVYCVPEVPTLFLPDDWPARVARTGALLFEAAAGRPATFANLARAVEAPPADWPAGDSARLTGLPDELVRPFLAVGFGYLFVEALFDAMEHEHLLDAVAFRDDVLGAAEAVSRDEPDATAALASLTRAAQRLLDAREVLYANPIHLLDLAFFDADRPGELTGQLANPFAVNLIATGEALGRLAAERPDLAALLRGRVVGEGGVPTLEVCGGVRREREDALLPVESQLWNLLGGRSASEAAVGGEVRVFARRKSSFHPHLPGWLQAAGLTRALLLNLDESSAPNYSTTVVHWPAPSGRQVEALARAPLPAHEAQTFFNLAYHLRQSISNDSAPTLAFAHRGAAAFDCHGDWLELSRLAPVLGTWETASRYFSDALAGEYVTPAGPDDYFHDYLDDRVSAGRPDPVSGFARQLRLRRRLDGAFTAAALLVSLSAQAGPGEAELVESLRHAEDEFERLGADLAETPAPPSLEKVEREAGRLLAGRLLARAASDRAGYLLVNPCSFARRAALELPWGGGQPAVAGPVRAAQADGDTVRLVVEVPGLGFAWVPSRGELGASAPKARLVTAEGTRVRNEFFEAEVDPQTGGLRTLADARTRAPRLGQQLVYNPGSRMRARSVRVTAAGSVLGEVTAEGDIVDDDDHVLARFRQRFRAWVGRPVLEVKIELEVVREPVGYPWHGYYGSRFAWRDERAVLLRGQGGGAGAATTHSRPVTPDFLEVRSGRQSLAILPMGLPFHQRHGNRMVDVILCPAGERGREWELAVALDRDQPAQVALGMVSPLLVVPVDRGPPPTGPSGWLWHLDASNVAVTSLRPEVAPSRAVVAHLIETAGVGSGLTVRCARDPASAHHLVGATGGDELSVSGDAVSVEVSAHDLLRVRVGF